MITLSIDKHIGKFGEKSDGLVEYYVLMDHITELAPQLKRCVYVPPMPLKQRLAFTNSTTYFCCIEFRIKNKFKQGAGLDIVHKEDSTSKAVSEMLYNSLSPYFQFETCPSIGYYHRVPDFGLDFFIEMNENPSVIVYLGYCNELRSIQDRKKQFCKIFADVINQVF